MSKLHSIIAYVNFLSVFPGTNDGNFGPNFKRDAKKGSPVVPESAVKIKEEGDSILYSVLTLKGHYIAASFDSEGKVVTPSKTVEYFEFLKAAFRDKRFTLRQYSFEPLKSGGIDALITQTQGNNNIHIQITYL